MIRSTAFNAIRCLKSSWELTTRAPAALWGAGLILAMVDGCHSKSRSDEWEQPLRSSAALAEPGWSFETYESSTSMGPVMMLGILGFSIVFLVAYSALLAWLRVGYYNGVKTLMHGSQVGFGDMYGNTRNWLRTFLTSVLRGLVFLFLGFGGILLIVIPVAAFGSGGAALLGFLVWLVIALPVYIYVSLGLLFMVQAAAIDGLSPLQALAKSWSLADGNRGDLILMCLLQIALVIIGFLALCVGAIPATLLCQIMWIEAYVQATDDGSARAGGSRPERDSPRAPSGPEPAPTPAAPESSSSNREGTFDPGAWRGDLDVPHTD